MVTFLDAILDKTLRSTVALLSGRGRGESTALGLAIVGTVAAGYSKFYITVPSPKNLKTLLDFVCKGFTMLLYKEHLDYDIVKSSNPKFKKSTVRINISKHQRQTIQTDGQAECTIQTLEDMLRACVIDFKVWKLRSKEIALVKVMCKNQKAEEATWESEDDMHERYPTLFKAMDDDLENTNPILLYFFHLVLEIVLAMSRVIIRG
ncbi:hypothetical protein FXO38_06997 [Capsicum annuum]|nr:hypothetical protein FXO37_25133 [Capsicum annuum]KAF3670610.1 hypothetical protein FXO38_06997 [Capsicum annuum]